MTSESTSPRKPTVADVAAAAGVSVGTVSHVLTRSHTVRPATRDRVVLAMEQLGFRPNQVARALVRHQTNTVGMVIPDIANPFFGELARGAEDVLGVADYATVFGNSDNDAKKEDRYLKDFDERRVDGLIVVIAAEAHSDDLRRLSAEIPTVVVDRAVAGWEGDLVVGDNRAGMGLAVRHLASLGHRRVALVNGDLRLSTARERGEGFALTAAEENLEVLSVTDGAFTLESGYEQIIALLRGPRLPTAVCAANDLLALGVLSGATEVGCRVPEDLSVVGFDDIAYARLARPSLTTIRQTSYDMGAEAARLLLGRISSNGLSARRIVMPPQLVVRASTASPGPER